MLLDRDTFRESVFARDKYKCVVCGSVMNISAHHILERKLFKEPFENGGYFIDNGVSLCEQHHIEAEQTILTCDHLRNIANIKNIILPSHLDADCKYDKWGNMYVSGGRIKGELYYDENVQKIIKGNFVKYVKYSRTYHFPDSNTSDTNDKVLKDDSQFNGLNVCVSIKYDGENCLSPDTLIQTEDGLMSILHICKTKYSGKVLSYNEELQIAEFQKVLNWNISIHEVSDEWFNIELENGSIIEITSEHYVYLPEFSCYRQVKHLKNNDEVIFLQLS